MPATYPGTLDSYTDVVANATANRALDINNLQAAVAAIETELGTDPAGVATNVKTRLANSLVVNVKDHGAIGNGTTDDLSYINSAITALSGSGDLYFSKGTYRIASNLTVASGISLVFEQGAMISVDGIAISAITKANPGKVTTSSAHGFSNGDKVRFKDVAGMTELNYATNGCVEYTVTVVNATSFTIGVDTSGYSAYTAYGKAQHIIAITGRVQSVSGQQLFTGDGTVAWNNKQPIQPDFFGTDGVDDQTELMKAVNALPLEGGKVQLLSHSYYISAPTRITNKSNITISGEGDASVLVAANTPPANCLMLYFTTVAKTTISGIRFYDPDPAAHLGTEESHGINLISSNDCIVTECYFDGIGDESIDTAGSNGIIITNNFFNNCSGLASGGGAVGLNSTINAVVANNNFSGGVGYSAITVETTSTLSKNITIANNVIEGGSWTSGAIYLNRAAATNENIVISNNIVDHTPAIATAGGFTLSNLDINNNILLGSIVFVNTTTKSKISNNIIQNAAGTGISAATCTEVAIEGNIIRDFPVRGISFLAMTNCLVKDNQLYNVADADSAIRCTGTATSPNIIKGNFINPKVTTTYGIQVEDAICTDNYITQVANDGIRNCKTAIRNTILDAGGYGMRCNKSGGQLINNNISGCASVGIFLSDASNLVISGNNISGGTNAIQETGTSDNNLIVGNNLVNAGAGVVIIGASSVARNNLGYPDSAPPFYQNIVVVGGDFGEAKLSTAMAAISGAAADNRYCIYVFGAITEDTNIVAKSYVDVHGFANATITSSITTNEVVDMPSITDSEWRNIKIIKTGAGASANAVLSFTGAGNTRVKFHRCEFDNQSTGAFSQYGVSFLSQCDDVVFSECTARGGNTTATSHGWNFLYGTTVAQGGLTLKNCTGYGNILGAHAFRFSGCQSSVLQECIAYPGLGNNSYGYLVENASAPVLANCTSKPQTVSHYWSYDSANNGRFLPVASHPYQVIGLMVYVVNANVGVTLSIGTSIGGSEVASAIDIGSTGGKYVNFTRVELAADAYLYATPSAGIVNDDVRIFTIVAYNYTNNGALFLDTVGHARISDGTFISNGASNACRIGATSIASPNYIISNCHFETYDTVNQKAVIGASAVSKLPLINCTLVGGYDTTIGENTQLTVDFMRAYAETGTWTPTYSSSLPLLTRTGAVATEVLQVPIPLSTKLITGASAKIINVKIAYSCNGSAAGDDIQVRLCKRALPADNSAPSAITVIAGDDNADYDTNHNTPAKRVDSTGAPENHTATMTVIAADRIAIAEGETWFLQLYVIDTAGSLAIVIKDLNVNYLN